jgi:hypothetical protein
MVVAALFGVLLLAMGIAAVCGWVADSRDPGYALGLVTAPRAGEGDEGT